MKTRLPSLTLTLVGLLLLADIAISFFYAGLPVTLTAVRAEVAFVQLIIMAITMLGALSWLIQSF